MTLNDRLAEIQKELKAPKGQKNSFGNYNYRSCEDIVEAVKPLLNGLTLTLSDEVVAVGDRFYVKATATLSDGKDTIQTTAFAREPLEKKGMDSSQITGACSSYSRKYSLNGMFAIDDTKDADTDEMEKQSNKPQGRAPVAPVKSVTPAPKVEVPKVETKVETKSEAPEAPARRRVAVPTEEVKPAPKVEVKQTTKPSEDQW